MAEVKVNGEPSPAGLKGGSEPDSSGQRGAKSVISIDTDKVTIVSTGRDGKSRASRVTTTPLRAHPSPSLTATPLVSTRVRDTQFVSALTQQFQANGSTLVAPSAGFPRSVPSSSTSSSRASHSRSSSSSSSTTEDLTSKLSSMLIQQQLQQQRQQRQQPIQHQEEETPQNASTAEESTPQLPLTDSSGSSAPSCPDPVVPDPVVPVPDPVVPAATQNGTRANGRDSGASSPEVPPPPPPSALLRSISEQPPALRKVDASYTPRPKSYSTQNSVTPGNGNPPGHNKNDLMATLTAVVTSGSAVAGLRKTRGPGRSGGVTEVFVSKKTSGASSTNGTASRREEN